MSIHAASSCCRAILWDVGGTLVDFAATFGDYVRSNLAGSGVPIDLLSDEQIETSYQRFYKNERLWRTEADVRAAQLSWARDLLGDVTCTADFGDVATRLSRYFDLYKPVDGIFELLREIRSRGLRQVIVSNWPPSLPRFLEHHGLTRLVDAVVFSAEDGVQKPDRRIYDRALAAAEVSVGEAVFIGDTPECDVLPPRALGMRAIHFDPRGRYAQPDARTTDELRRILHEMIGISEEAHA